MLYRCIRYLFLIVKSHYGWRGRINSRLLYFERFPFSGKLLTSVWQCLEFQAYTNRRWSGEREKNRICHEFLQFKYLRRLSQYYEKGRTLYGLMAASIDGGLSSDISHRISPMPTPIPIENAQLIHSSQWRCSLCCYSNGKQLGKCSSICIRWGPSFSRHRRMNWLVHYLSESRLYTYSINDSAHLGNFLDSTIFEFFKG